jgi:hypothetical protein
VLLSSSRGHPPGTPVSFHPAGKEVPILLLRLPLTGRISHLSALSRFSRTLATLVAGAIPVDRALRIVAPVVGNTVIAAQIGAAADRVVEGTALSEALRVHAEIPATLVQMVAVGEESGKLDFILSKMADAMIWEIEARLTSNLSLLEPLIILFMGSWSPASSSRSCCPAGNLQIVRYEDEMPVRITLRTGVGARPGYAHRNMVVIVILGLGGACGA